MDREEMLAYVAVQVRSLGRADPEQIREFLDAFDRLVADWKRETRPT